MGPISRAPSQHVSTGIKKMAKYCRNQRHFPVARWLCGLIIQTPKFTEMKSRPTRISSQNDSSILVLGSSLNNFLIGFPVKSVQISCFQPAKRLQTTDHTFWLSCCRPYKMMSPKSLKIKSVRLITDRDFMTVYQLLIWHDTEKGETDKNLA